MSTLAVVEKILRETGSPMSVREIVEAAGDELPTRSKTPDTVVARDLSMDIKKKGETSPFIRTSPGRYTMREMWMAKQNGGAQPTVAAPPAQTTETDATEVLAHAIRHERAATLAAKRTARPAVGSEQKHQG